MNLGQAVQTMFLAGYELDPVELTQRFGLTITKTTAPALLQIQAGKEAAQTAATPPTPPPPTASGEARPVTP